jgi:protein-L-isoaspartate(D-aspartate) O-methyltransferase
MINYAEARDRMVERQLVRRGIQDARVLAAARHVPRERFLAADLGEFAYDDGPLPIGEGQTISQPYIVALMSEAALLGVEDRVLEVGAGSGYAAALLGELAREVHSVERHESLAKEAGRRLAELAPNVRVHLGDGTLGSCRRGQGCTWTMERPGAAP